MIIGVIIKNLLLRVLNKYFKNLNPQFSGSTLKILDAELQQEAFDNLRLKYCLIKGCVKRLMIRLPVSNLKNEPVVVSVEGVVLILKPREDFYYDQVVEKKKMRDQKKEDIKNIELLQSAKKKAAKYPEKPEKDSFVTKLLVKVIENLQVNLSDIYIRIEDRSTRPESPYALGVTLESMRMSSCDKVWRPIFVPAAGAVGHKASMKLVRRQDVGMDLASTAKEIEDRVHKRAESCVGLLSCGRGDLDDEDSASTFFKLIEFEMLSVYIEPTLKKHSSIKKSKKTEDWEDLKTKATIKRALRDIPRSTHVAGHMPHNQDFILRPVNFAIRMSQNISKRIPPDVPKTNINISFNTIDICLDSEQLEAFAKFKEFGARAEALELHRIHRPSVPVKGNAKLWWKHAIQSVKEDNALLKNNCTWKSFWEHKARREEYVQLYKTKLNSVIAAVTKTKEEQRLEELEDDLSAEDIVFFRGVAEEEVRKTAGFFSFAKLKNMKATLLRQEGGMVLSSADRDELYGEIGDDDDDDTREGMDKNIEIRIPYIIVNQSTAGRDGNRYMLQQFTIIVQQFPSHNHVEVRYDGELENMLVMGSGVEIDRLNITKHSMKSASKKTTMFGVTLDLPTVGQTSMKGSLFVSPVGLQQIRAPNTVNMGALTFSQNRTTVIVVEFFKRRHNFRITSSLTFEMLLKAACSHWRLSEDNYELRDENGATWPMKSIVAAEVESLIQHKEEVDEYGFVIQSDATGGGTPVMFLEARPFMQRNLAKLHFGADMKVYRSDSTIRKNSRWISLSENDQILTIGKRKMFVKKHKKSKSTVRIDMTMVLDVGFGRRRAPGVGAWARRDLQWLSFYIVLPNRVWEFSCESEEITLTWILGLQYIASMYNSEVTRMTRSQLILARVRMKIDYTASRKGMDRKKLLVTALKQTAKEREDEERLGLLGGRVDPLPGPLVCFNPLWFKIGPPTMRFYRKAKRIIFFFKKDDDEEEELENDPNMDYDSDSDQDTRGKERSVSEIMNDMEESKDTREDGSKNPFSCFAFIPCGANGIEKKKGDDATDKKEHEEEEITSFGFLEAPKTSAATEEVKLSDDAKEPNKKVKFWNKKAKKTHDAPSVPEEPAVEVELNPVVASVLTGSPAKGSPGKKPPKPQ